MTCTATPAGDGVPCGAAGSERVLMLGETPVGRMTLCEACERSLSRILAEVHRLAGLRP